MKYYEFKIVSFVMIRKMLKICNVTSDWLHNPDYLSQLVDQSYTWRDSTEVERALRILVPSPGLSSNPTLGVSN